MRSMRPCTRISGGSRRWSSKRKGWRREFDVAAGYVKPQDRVLDVGCAFGGFRDLIPQARYTGLDPNIAKQDPLGEVLMEAWRIRCPDEPALTMSSARSQVMEHVADPLSSIRG